MQSKYMFFSVGRDRDQPRLRATDPEHANGAKQRVIAKGIPRRQRFNPRVVVRDGSPEGVREPGPGLQEEGKDGGREGSMAMAERRP